MLIKGKMGVSNFKKEDLVGTSLERLLSEIESLSQDGRESSYKELEDFIIELDKVTSDATFMVSEDGSKKMKIRDKEIDVSETLKKITGKINSGIDGNSATVDEHKARESLRKKISETVGVLLKEDEIMKELAERGMTNDEFIRNAEEEIARSQEKVATLEPLREDMQKRLDLFGKTVYLETSKSYLSKSKIDELRYDKQAMELLAKVEEKLDELQKLQDGAKTMDSTSADYENNKRAIEKLCGDVKGLAGTLKSLDLHTAPNGAPVGRRTTSIDFSYLENLDANSNFIDARTTTDNIAIEDLIIEDYENIKDIMKANLAEFGFVDEASVDALTSDEVEAKLLEVQKEYDKVNKEIEFEKAYQEQTRGSIEKFKTKTEREEQLSGKFTTVKRKVKQEKKKPDGTPELDADGKPVMEEVEKEFIVPTEEARKDYLAAAGIADEVAYKNSKVDAARVAEESKEAAMTVKEKRDLIRKSYQKEGEWHPFKWLKSQLFPSRMWEKEYKDTYLADKISAAEKSTLATVEKELNSKIDEKADLDYVEAKALSNELAYVRKAYQDAIKSAVSQEKMTDELYKGQTYDHVKEGARRGAMTESLNAVSDVEMLIAIRREAKGEITKEQLAEIQENYTLAVEKRVMNDNRTVQDRAHADKVINPNTSRESKTPTYGDER